MTAQHSVCAVVIGRNEGARLERCLTSLAPQVDHLIYVDSGSTDNSVPFSESIGAHVVQLDTSVPFTAARARNAGFDAAVTLCDPDFVQFIDGDCGVENGWVASAADTLRAEPELGLVTGWRSEIHPDTSVYNALCDFEWHRPAGDIKACGGDMMVRAKAFEKAGKFDPQVIAAEDDEFCQRLSKAGWGLRRIPVDMTRHDADMTRFGQWWQRAVRSGHGFAQVGDLHPDYFRPERKRVAVFGAILPCLAIIGALLFWPLLIGVLGLYAVSYVRTVQGLIRENLPAPKARHQAVLLSLSKIPNMIGMVRYFWRKRFNRAMRIIEYK